MIPKKSLSLFVAMAILAFCIPYAQGMESLQSKEAGYIAHQPATTSTPGSSTVSTSQHVIERNHPTEARLAIPSWLKSQDEAVYRRFVNGVLIYRPNPESDDGKIVLPIADLPNPLEGTFDLSQCGEAGKDLSISTGYRKGKKAENANKQEIWFTPRFLVEKELHGTASHFKGIFPARWTNNAPVGIIWTWGDWEGMDSYDYLTGQSMEVLSNNNLYKKWLCGVRVLVAREGMVIGSWITPHMQNFIFIL